MEQQVEKNEYMAQVMREQAEVQGALRARKACMPARGPAAGGEAARDVLAAITTRRVLPPDGGASGGLGGGDAPAVDVRITGSLWWKRVIVPPNAFVVHTRLGHAKPMHVGLGTSFRFDEDTDSFLVVPAAMQTITISANSICTERQGILVQGYVQWRIEDFSIAYRKLDFSDPTDPLRVVNVQLREQAEATIKDTVAGMSIDQVLADKQPIIEELTTRLRQLAEGTGKDEGLGLRIITVQIKEAVVSSTRVWESLQRPFRADRARIARLAELESETEVQRRESAAERERERETLASEQALAVLRQQAEAQAFDREQQERARRAALEARTLAATVAHAQEKLRLEGELARATLELELAREALKAQAAHEQARRQLALDVERHGLENDVSPGRLQELLIRHLPEIASKLPKPTELKTVSFSGADQLGPLLRELRGAVRDAAT